MFYAIHTNSRSLLLPFIKERWRDLRSLPKLDHREIPLNPPLKKGLGLLAMTEHVLRTLTPSRPQMLSTVYFDHLAGDHVALFH